MGIQVDSATDTAEQVQAVNAGAEAKTEATNSASKPEPGTDETAAASDAAEELEVDEAADEEAEDTDESEEEEGDSKQDEKPKKKNGFKKRIDKLSKRAAAAEERARYLEEQLQKQSAKPEPQQNKAQVQTQESEGKPDADEFETQAEYLEAMANWIVDQREAKKEQQKRETELKAERAKTAETFQSRMSEFVKAHSDFDELMEDVNDIALHPLINEVFTTSESGPALMYELAKNRADLERIAALSPTAALRELGKIEARLEKQIEQPQVEKKQTKAPPPLRPIGAGKATQAKTIFDEGLPFKEFEKLRAEQTKGR